MDADRRAELAKRLGEVRARIAAACAAAGRSVEDVTLIGVTKGFAAPDVQALADLGIADVGESRDQEARQKHPAVLAGQTPLRWHMIGQLQSNKARSVAAWSSMVHTVDRPSLVQALDKAVLDARGASKPLDVLIQLSIDGDVSRGGALGADVPALADRIAAADGLRLRGLMVVAPRQMDPIAAFEAAARAAADLRADHPSANLLSAGMTGDFEAAIAVGATHVRVGTALLGDRRGFV